VIPYGRQDILQEDIDSVVEVLNSDYLTQGPLVPAFEEAIASKVLAQYAVAVNSATSALHISCLALELTSGDILWTTANTFVASANCGRYCGADVDFVDIDPKTFNLCPEYLKNKLRIAAQKNALPKILVTTHLCGLPCEMKEINLACKKYGVRIIEDASHAIGSKYKDAYIGNCKYSDITVFSFHPVKIITSGEGGIALTNDLNLASKMQLFRSHGITKKADFMKNKPDGIWYYEQQELGFNYRMTDIQAALGLSQLNRLDAYVEKRHIIANYYDKHLSNLPISSQKRLPHCYSSMHLYVIRLNLDKISISHKDFFEYMINSGIGVNLHYIPVHMHPYYQKLGFQKGNFPEAEAYYSSAISLPIHPNLSAQDQNYVIEVISKALD
jgi:UDP-4-amino-4,6-dideoxy-N-acetyl-beta-L-altrosamine transaminase